MYRTNLLKNLEAFVWDTSTTGAPVWQRALRRVLRVLSVLVRDFSAGNLNLQAMSLVYTTLLASIPALAIVFSVLKGFGVDEQLREFLIEFLAPLGDEGVEIRETILDFVAQVNIGVLGSVGFAVLIYTGVSLLQKVEAALNDIWQVSRLGTLVRRFSNFASLLLAGPIAIVIAMGLLASVTGAAAIDQLGSDSLRLVISEMSRFVPYMLTVAAFTAVYLIIPNTHVRLGAALIGAAIAGLAWNIAGWAFTSFVVTSARYALIYSAFASLAVFMIWLYVSWLILLIGASIAFYAQNPAYLTRSAVYRLSIDARERLALDIAVLVARAFEQGEEPWSLQRLARSMNLPVPPVERVVRFLLQSGLLTETRARDPGIVPSRPLDKITVQEWLSTVREGAEGQAHLLAQPGSAVIHDHDAVSPLIARLDDARAEALGATTLRDLARASQKIAAPAPTAELASMR